MILQGIKLQTASYVSEEVRVLFWGGAKRCDVEAVGLAEMSVIWYLVAWMIGPQE